LEYPGIENCGTYRNKLKLASLLIEHGADVNAKDSHGKRPMDNITYDVRDWIKKSRQMSIDAVGPNTTPPITKSPYGLE